MKISLISLLTVCLSCFSLTAADATLKSPRFKAQVVCFVGKLDSAIYCANTWFFGKGTSNTKCEMTCGSPGEVSQITWSFVERRGTNDIYRFTRRFPLDSASSSTTTKNVEFSNSRVVVFEDKFQAIVIEPSNDKDRVP
jgi:hypothetical protein